MGENKIAIAEANLGTALEERAKVQKVHDTLVAAKNEVKMAIDGGGSAVQDLVDKTKRTEGMAADIEKQVSSMEKRVDVEIQQKQQLEQEMNKVTSQVSQIEGEVRSLESALTASEEERALKDEQIKTEIAHQADMVAKLIKEKKGFGDDKQKIEEDIQTMEDKCNHLSKIKGKLEQSLDEAEDAVEREKKVRNDWRNQKRN